jgi:hypothetical protein
VDLKTFKYLPAISPSTVSSLINKIGWEKTSKCTWWDKNGFFQYTDLLISAFYGMQFQKRRKESNRKSLHIPDNILLWGDSGGFQSRELGKCVPNEEILDWYEDNCDFGFVQDYPEKYLKLRQDIKDKKFDLSGSEIMKRMAEYQAESNVDFIKRKLTKCKIYNILHGTSLSQMDNWFETVKNDKMYGWALGVGSGDPWAVAMLLAFVYSKGVRKNVHLFGTSGFDVIPVVAEASKYIDNITFDSSSWAIGSIYRWYFLPIDPRKKIRMGDISGGRYDSLPCDCPVCSSIKDVSKIYTNNSIAGHLLSLHNLFQALKFVDMFRKLRQVPNDFRMFANTLFGERIITVFDYLNEAMVNFPKANSKYLSMRQNYKSLFETDQAQVYKQDSILQELFPGEDVSGRKKKKKVKVEELEEM